MKEKILDIIGMIIISIVTTAFSVIIGANEKWLRTLTMCILLFVICMYLIIRKLWKKLSYVVQEYSYNIKETHSYLFELLISYGIVGVALFFAVFLGINIKLIKEYINTKNNNIWNKKLYLCTKITWKNYEFFLSKKKKLWI